MLERKLRQILISFLIVSLSGSFVFGFLGGLYAHKHFQSPSSSPSVVSPPISSKTDYEEQVIKVVQTAENSVVSVIATKDLPVIEQYFVNPFPEIFPDFGPWGWGFEFRIPQFRQKGVKKQEISAGSGWIVDSRGYVVTNKHVVSDTEADYLVLTNEGKKYPAKVIARDPAEDLAVLKIILPKGSTKKFTPLPLGDSDKIVLGETAIAIGNALGEFKNTVSVGVISGLNRTITASGLSGETQTLTNVIQTDAAINRGNSGGPLLNLKGEVIGINTAMVSGAQNIGFAIPINKLKKALRQALETGKIRIPFLGIRYILVTPALQEERNLPVDYGALITSGDSSKEAVVPNSPADKAGLQEGDIILEMNGQKINKNHQLADLVRNCDIGEVVTLKVLRQRKSLTIKVKLGERKEYQ